MKFILGREKWFLENISHYFYEIKENGLLHRYWEKKKPLYILDLLLKRKESKRKGS